MRVAVISSCPEVWGGSEELWFAAADRLLDGGHEVTVTAFGARTSHPRLDSLRDRGVPLVDLGRANTGREWRVVEAVAPRRLQPDEVQRTMLIAGSHLARRRPDVVLISQGDNLDGAVFARVSRTLRLPYVLVAQKASDHEWPDDRWRPYYRKVLRAAAACVFVSHHTQRLTEEQIGAPLDNARVIRNPLLHGREGALPWPDRTGCARLACVARLWVDDKGQDIALRTLALPKWRGRPVSVDFYGGGPHREGLEGLAGRLGVGSARFHGHVSDIDEIWRGTELLVLPSRAEGQSLALAEAMACGRPAVVTDVGGNAELVVDGETGFVAKGASVAELDDALEKAWAHLDDWPAMGEAAALRAKQILDHDPGRTLAELLAAAAMSR